MIDEKKIAELKQLQETKKTVKRNQAFLDDMEQLVRAGIGTSVIIEKNIFKHSVSHIRAMHSEIKRRLIGEGELNDK